jgi:voltage-gated potassium channel
MFQILIRFFRKIGTSLGERKIVIYACIYMVCLWTVATVVFHFFEKGISLLDSLYWSIATTSTVGYGDITPQTAAGKIVSMMVMLSGVGVLGLLLASFADFIMERTLIRGHFNRSHMQGHTIVCGWDKKLEIGVKELLSEDKEVVVVAEVEFIPIEDRNLMLIQGDPSNDDNLVRANAEKASFALISGKDDAETLLSAIAVEKLNEDIRTTCIVSDPKVIKALEGTGVDQILSTDEFFGLFLSRSIFVPNISGFLKELMDVKGMDIHQEENPEWLEGKPFIETMNILKEKHNAILVGIVREKKVTLNPENELRLKKEDKLLYIAEERLSIS